MKKRGERDSLLSIVLATQVNLILCLINLAFKYWIIYAKEYARGTERDSFWLCFGVVCVSLNI